MMGQERWEGSRATDIIHTAEVDCDTQMAFLIEIARDRYSLNAQNQDVI